MRHRNNMSLASSWTGVPCHETTLATHFFFCIWPSTTERYMNCLCYRFHQLSQQNILHENRRRDRYVVSYLNIQRWRVPKRATWRSPDVFVAYQSDPCSAVCYHKQTNTRKNNSLYIMDRKQQWDPWSFRKSAVKRNTRSRSHDTRISSEQIN